MSIERPKKLPLLKNVEELAASSYQHERGTKKAIDGGRITMQELIIYHYVYAWLNENNMIPRRVDDPDPPELTEACNAVQRVFNATGSEIKAIFKKVLEISRS